MSSTLNPYISFRDDARAAMEFYQSVLGGQLNLNTFGDFGASDDPAETDKIMHAQLETTAGFVLMGADTPSSMTFDEGARVTISMSGDDESELRGYWDGLAAGATIAMPLEPAPWGDQFGMLADKFGVNWMINIAGAQPS